MSAVSHELCSLSGNFLVVSSTTSVAIALTWAGVQYPWGSARVVVPLVIGTCGQVLFIYYEARVASNPIVSRANGQEHSHVSYAVIGPNLAIHQPHQPQRVSSNS